MRKSVLLLCLGLFMVSCHKDVTIEVEPSKDYPLLIKNVSHGEIFVQSKQLTRFMFSLEADETSELLYSSSEEVELKWFGEGTYYKQRKGVFVLQKDKLITIELASSGQ